MGISLALFAVAVLHTFFASSVHHFSHRFPTSSLASKTLQVLGEVEIPFSLWSVIFLLILLIHNGTSPTWSYLRSLDFQGPIFVLAILVAAGTKPIHNLARKAMSSISRGLSKTGILPLQAAEYFVALSLGSLLGSLITEPAAMTLSAWFLKEKFLDQSTPDPLGDRFKYATLAVLLVSVSIGGILTPYAAPPVLMVAPHWGWGFKQMFLLFGWRALLAVIANSAGVTWIFRTEIASARSKTIDLTSSQIPLGTQLISVLFLAAIVGFSQNSAALLILFAAFLIFVASSPEQNWGKLRLKESALVSAFLAGLVILGGPQEVWISPILQRLNTIPLYLGTASLTAIMDNAALTYLGSQVPHLSQAAQIALLAGAVAGGGLTVMANAPNPAGFSILRPCFGDDGIKPSRLLLYAAVPTGVALAILGTALLIN